MTPLARQQPLRHLLLVGLAAITLTPFVVMLFTSAKDTGQITLSIWALPSPIRWENYHFGYVATVRYLFNSTLIAVLTCVLTIAAAALAGYGLSRLRFAGRGLIYAAIIALLMVPGTLLVVPLFLTVRELGLLNSYAGLILPQVAGGLPLAVFLFTGFFRTLPEDLFAAARIDGASEWRILFAIVLPLSLPIINTIAILNLLGSWNAFVWPLLCIRDESLRTIPVGLAFLWTEQSLRAYPGKLMAAYVVASIPPLVVFLLAMKPFMRGVTSGALKG
jgi:ABC-type glycerol-3-phosphate transport system permease component